MRIEEDGYGGCLVSVARVRREVIAQIPVDIW